MMHRRLRRSSRMIGNDISFVVNVQFEYIKAHTELQDEHSLGNSIAD